LAGERVVITGASSGIGAALARHYAARGATLALIARREDALNALARELPGSHHIYVADVADAGAMLAAGEDFMARAGVPDVVVANAGISVGTLTGEREDLPAFRKVFETNVLGMVHTFHPFVGPMRQARAGRLVGVTSVAGIRGLPGAGAYSASKAAAISYLESLRIELCGSGVRVVTLAPGYIETPMTAVNRYRMPFLLPVDAAARRLVRAIDAGASFAVVPWQMALVARVMRLLPDRLFDALAARAGRKPRNLAL
jgi:short-subunit dehydrogenase